MSKSNKRSEAETERNVRTMIKTGGATLISLVHRAAKLPFDVRKEIFNDWERTFLADISISLGEFNNLTTKQTMKVRDILSDDDVITALAWSFDLDTIEASEIATSPISEPATDYSADPTWGSF